MRRPPPHARDPMAGVQWTRACCSARRAELEAGAAELEGALARERSEKEAARGESQALGDRPEFVGPIVTRSRQAVKYGPRRRAP